MSMSESTFILPPKARIEAVRGAVVRYADGPDTGAYEPREEDARAAEEALRAAQAAEEEARRARETEALVAAARQQAIAETEARLRAEWQAEKTAIESRWSKIESELETFFKTLQEEISQQLISMSVKLAEIVVRHNLPDKEMLEEVIRTALEPISDLQGVRVRLHPREAEALQAQRDASDVPNVSDRIEIVSDSTLDPGDAMIESRNGYFDARIDQRMRLLEENLKKRYRKAHADNPPA